MCLRLIDTGGQDAYQFLKSLVLRGRSLVLLCVNGCDPQDAPRQVLKHMDILRGVLEREDTPLVEGEGGSTSSATLSNKPRVLLVATQADSSDFQLDVMREVWQRELVPLCARYEDKLGIDTRFLCVSAREPQAGDGLALLQDRMRENIAMVFFFFCDPFFSFFSFFFFFLFFPFASQVLLFFSSHF